MGPARNTTRDGAMLGEGRPARDSSPSHRGAVAPQATPSRPASLRSVDKTTPTPAPPPEPPAPEEAPERSVAPATTTPVAPATTTPVDPTAPVADDVAPSEAPPISGTMSVGRKPLLASEALRDDLAPVEPLRREARIWAAGVGAASLVFGALPLLGLLSGGMPAALPWLVTGGIALVAAVTPVSYRQRAVAMVVLGLLSGVVALQGASGALMDAGGGPAWGLARLAAAVALPAALLFRARYRAYTGARIALGAALFLSLPFGVHTVLGLFAPMGLTTAGAVAVLFVLAGSMGGFMGAETTGAGAYMAPAAVVAIAADLALRALGHGALLGVATDAVAFVGAAALASIGLFQILAWRFAADARRIDLHSRPRESTPPASERDASSDWSTRD